jgi:trigger factor
MATVLKHKRSGYTVNLEIEASRDEINAGLDRAFAKLAKHAKLPGFRKGKVTRRLFEANYGKEAIVQEALPDVVNHAYSEAVRQLELAVVDFPRDVTIGTYSESEPLSFTCAVDVEPEVKLGKYKGLKVTRLSDTADDAAVQTQINQLLESRAQYQESDADSADGDILLVNLNATINGEPYAAWTRENMGVRLGMATFGADFDKELVGAKKGVRQQFSVTYPDDFTTADVAGKTVQFDAEVTEVRAKQLPELTDEFVKTFGEFDSVDAFKTQIKDNLNAQAKQDSETKLHQELFDAITDDLTVDIPEGMIRSELDHSIQEFKGRIQQQLRLDFAKYLSIINKTEEDIRNEWRNDAIKRVKTELSVRAIADKEKIDATDADLNAEIEKMKLPSIANLDEFKNSQFAASLDRLKDMVKRQKTVQFIIDNAKIV